MTSASDQQPPVDVVRRLDRRLARAQAGSRLPSVVASAFGPAGRWNGAAGLVDGTAPTRDTQYRIGSITKTMVAVAVLRLHDEGVLDLADRVVDHLADPRPLTDHPIGRATVAQLLQHAGGTGAETPGPWWERTPGGDLPALLAAVGAVDPAGPSGRRFHYSNVGFGLLGGVLAQHRGRPWDEVVTDELLGPLGMDRTTTRPSGAAAPGLAVHPFSDRVLDEPEHDAGAMAPAGQLWSTLDDLVAWGRFLAGHHDAPDGPLLADGTRRAMGVPAVVAHQPGQRWTTAHGLGVQLYNTDGVLRVGHGGSMPGFLATVRTAPDSGVGVAVMTNTTAGLDPTLVADLLEVADEEFADLVPWSPSAPPDGADELVGVWFWGPRPHEVRADGEVLHLGTLDGLGRASRFVPDGDGWVGLDGYYAGERLRVVRGDDGSVAWLDLASFVLTRTPYDPNADVPGGVTGWR